MGDKFTSGFSPSCIRTIHEDKKLGTAKFEQESQQWWPGTGVGGLFQEQSKNAQHCFFFGVSHAICIQTMQHTMFIQTNLNEEATHSLTIFRRFGSTRTLGSCFGPKRPKTDLRNDEFFSFECHIIVF